MMFDERRFVALIPLGSGQTYVAAQLFGTAPFELAPADVVPAVREHFADFGPPVVAPPAPGPPGPRPLRAAAARGSSAARR